MSTTPQPTRWQQDFRVSLMFLMGIVTTGLLALDGWVLGAWIGLLIALAVVAVPYGLWARKRRRFLPVDVKASLVWAFVVLLVVGFGTLAILYPGDE